MRLLTVAAAVAALLVPAAPAFAGDPTMPLWQVSAGMRCTGYSVVQGTTISSFNVDVLDVAGGEATGGARILIGVSGPAVDATGIGPGFSGSPIYCPDGAGTNRVIGAISESINEYGGKAALATPIDAIIGTPVDVPGRTNATVSRDARRPRAAEKRGCLAPDEGGARVGEADRRADERERAHPVGRERADDGLGEGRAAGARGAAGAARDVPAADVAARFRGRGRVLDGRRADQLGRDGHVRRRRPGVGLRPPARGRRAARAAPAGRVRVPDRQQPAGAGPDRHHLQAGVVRPRPGDDQLGRLERRRGPDRRAPAHGPRAGDRA